MTNLETGSGRAAQPKTSAKMAMFGELHLMLTPEHIRRALEGRAQVYFGEAKECVLRIEQGPQDRIVKMSPWFDAAETRVVIGNSFQTDGVEEDGRHLYDYTYFILKESKESEMAFSVTPAQARILAAALADYANAWDALEALGAERHPA